VLCVVLSVFEKLPLVSLLTSMLKEQSLPSGIFLQKFFPESHISFGRSNKSNSYLLDDVLMLDYLYDSSELLLLKTNHPHFFNSCSCDIIFIFQHPVCSALRISSCFYKVVP
jgi:hypothetical protein